MTLDLPDNRFDGKWTWYPRTDELAVNERWLRLQGLQLGATVSRQQWFNRIHPEDSAILESKLVALQRGGRQRDELELRVRHGQGHWIWLVLYAFVLRDPCDGNYLVHGLLQDITTRKQQEAMLRGDQFYLGRTEPMPGVGTWHISCENRCVSWSDETCRIHGRKPGHQPSFEEVINYYAASARPAIRACLELALSQGNSFDIELPLIRSDRKRIMVRCIGTVEYFDDQFFQISGALQDVTDTTSRHLEHISHSHGELERLNERLSMATSSGGIGIWDLDIQRSHFVWDQHLFELYDLDETSDRIISAAQWLRMIHRDDRQRVREAVQSAILDQRSDALEFRIITASGQVRNMRGTARIIRDATGRTIRLVGTNQDVTEARRLTQELAREREVLAVTLRSIGDGVITTDSYSRVIWMNPVAEKMLGWSTEQAQGRHLCNVYPSINVETREAMPDPVHTCLIEDRIVDAPEPTLLNLRNGKEFWVEDSVAPIRCDEDQVHGAVLTFHDVTEQRAIAREMTWRATHDALTGLINRSEFESILLQLHNATRENDSVHAVLFIDLDQFKIVNDSCGHSAGDQLLKQISGMLEHVVLSKDCVARLGGDEFAVILENRSIEQAGVVAQHICDLMDKFRFTHQGQRFRIGVSIGLVPINSNWPNVSTIIRAADTACYMAKEAGRNRVHLWSETDKSTRRRHVQTTWATRLATALDENRFELFAQRIDALDGMAGDQVSGITTDGSCALDGGHAEILLRLSDEGRHRILPGAFLPAAERYNLINRIDQWVLNRVIECLERYSNAGGFGTLWVNLSGQSLEDRRFQHQTLELLGGVGSTHCQSLCFEITETAAVTNLAEAATYINELRDLGVRVALDDFGSGASSFCYIKTLPVDFLKIDGQFVRSVTDDPLDDAAIRCFTEVARILGIRTVAEHVESEKVLNRLKEIGVDYVQGRWLQEPIPIAELLKCSEQGQLVRMA